MLRDSKITQSTPGRLRITGTCPVTKEPWELIVKEKEFDDWQNGALIQDAFPELSADQRELLITGINNKGWKKLFKKGSK